MIARHITGQLNVLADLASRQGQVIRSEWKLSDQAFRWMRSFSPWGPPEIELYANSMNFHLSQYVSQYVSGRPRVGDRCDVMPVTSGHGSLCVSSGMFTASVSSEITTTAAVSSTVGGAMVSASVMDSAVEQLSDSVPTTVPIISDNAGAASLGPSSGRIVATQSDSSLFDEQRLLDLGYSRRVVDRLMLSHSVHTQKNYKSKWVLFLDWASKRDPPCDPTHPSVALMSEFMEWLFRVLGIQASSINNYRSAIAFFWKRVCDYTLPTDAPVFKDLMRSFKRERPKPSRTVVQ